MLINILLLLYGAVVLVAIFIFLFSQSIILVQLKTLFKFHSLFLLPTLFIYLIQYPQVSPLYILGLVLLIGLCFIFKNAWIFVHYQKDKTTEVIEGSLKMILFPFQKTDVGYRLSHSNGEANILIKPLFASVAFMTFENKFAIKKVDVLKALLVKKFSKIFPRFTIHI